MGNESTDAARVREAISKLHELSREYSDVARFSMTTITEEDDLVFETFDYEVDGQYEIVDEAAFLAEFHEFIRGSYEWNKWIPEWYGQDVLLTMGELRQMFVHEFTSKVRKDLPEFIQAVQIPKVES